MVYFLTHGRTTGTRITVKQITNSADAKNHVSLLATSKNPHVVLYMVLVIEVQYNKLELGQNQLV